MAINKERRPDILDFLKGVGIAIKILLFDTGAEILLGLKRHTLPLQRCLIAGAVLSLLYYLRADVFFFEKIHLPILILTGTPRLIMATYLPMLPIHFWGLGSFQKKMSLKKDMKRLFESVGLQTRLKETPIFISDEPVDDWTRKLKFLSRGLPVGRYLERKAEIESILNASIIKASNPFSRRDIVEIVYSKVDMPTLWKLDSILTYGNFSFPIGMTWGREISTSLLDVPHFLVAGESGGGKSTFISMMTAVLLATNDDLEVVFVDMKGGVQSRVFEGFKNVSVASEPKEVNSKLGTIIGILEERMKIFRQKNVRNLETYNLKAGGSDQKQNRILFVIDEFSELVPKLSSGNREVLTEIIQRVGRIARMGRAVGIHLVVGIQKPDANNLDPVIKANLPGIVCFPVTHFSQSMLILGDGRAADLNAEVKGRAIWKYGIEQIEVQTPYVSEQEIETVKKSLNRKEQKSNEQNRDLESQGPAQSTDAEAAFIPRSRDTQVSLEMESDKHGRS